RHSCSTMLPYTPELNSKIPGAGRRDKSSRSFLSKKNCRPHVRFKSESHKRKFAFNYNSIKGKMERTKPEQFQVGLVQDGLASWLLMGQWKRHRISIDH